MDVMIGSARVDESGSYGGGKDGDQKQHTTPDLKGEVSMQTFYKHKKGWYILRAKHDFVAEKLCNCMKNACNNPNIGYDQINRLGIIKYGTSTKIKTECDCSSLVRQCIIESTGKDPGNFTTANEADFLEKTGYFEKRKVFRKGMTLYNGDILVTKTKGHTAIVVSGAGRSITEYYPAYDGFSISIVVALRAVGADFSYQNRKKIAAANGICGYKGTTSQNSKLLSLLRQGKLIKV